VQNTEGFGGASPKQNVLPLTRCLLTRSVPNGSRAGCCTHSPPANLPGRDGGGCGGLGQRGARGLPDRSGASGATRRYEFKKKTKPTSCFEQKWVRRCLAAERKYGSLSENVSTRIFLLNCTNLHEITPFLQGGSAAAPPQF